MNHYHQTRMGASVLCHAMVLPVLRVGQPDLLSQVVDVTFRGFGFSEDEDIQLVFLYGLSNLFSSFLRRNT